MWEIESADGAFAIYSGAIPFVQGEDGMACNRANMGYKPLSESEWNLVKAEAERQNKALFIMELKSVVTSIALVALQFAVVAAGLISVQRNGILSSDFSYLIALVLIVAFTIICASFVFKGEGMVAKPKRGEFPMGDIDFRVFDEVPPGHWDDVRYWISDDPQSQGYVKAVLEQDRPLNLAEYWALQERHSEVRTRDPLALLRTELNTPEPNHRSKR